MDGKAFVRALLRPRLVHCHGDFFRDVGTPRRTFGRRCHRIRLFHVGNRARQRCVLILAGEYRHERVLAGLSAWTASPSSLASRFGGLAAVLKIGHTLPFPSDSALGKNCADGYSAMYQWAAKTLSLVPTVGLGYVSWFALLAGFVALLRVCRSRTLPMGGRRRRLFGACSDRMDAAAGLLPPSRRTCDGTGSWSDRLRCAKKLGVGWRPPGFGHHIPTIHSVGAFASCCNRSIKSTMETYRPVRWDVDGCVTSHGSLNVGEGLGGRGVRNGRLENIRWNRPVGVEVARAGSRIHFARVADPGLHCICVVASAAIWPTTARTRPPVVNTGGFAQLATRL